MVLTKEVDIYVDKELALKDVPLSYDEFDLHSEEPQKVTGTLFLPHGDYYTQEKVLVIDFKDGVYAKARITESIRLCDEWQSDITIIDAADSLAAML